MCEEYVKKLMSISKEIGQNTVRFLPKKNNTDTETLRLVYNKFKIDYKHADKTRR